ncbi:MAG: SlyX family protein [Qingshengfaniella sp.]
MENGQSDRITALEEQLAHLERGLADLSDIVARQDRDLIVLQRRVGLLMEREAERETAAGGQSLHADPPPPHY